MPLSPECLTVFYTRHGRRDGADDRIVELVLDHTDRLRSLDYSFAAKLRTRLKALGIHHEVWHVAEVDLQELLQHAVGHTTTIALTP